MSDTKINVERTITGKSIVRITKKFEDEDSAYDYVEKFRAWNKKI